MRLKARLRGITMTENTTSDGSCQPVAQPTTAAPVGCTYYANTPASQPVSDNWYDKYNGLQGYIRPIKRNRRRRNSETGTQTYQHRLPNATRATTSNCQGNEAIPAELPTLKETLSTKEQRAAAAQSNWNAICCSKHGVRMTHEKKLVLSAQLPTEELGNNLGKLTISTAQQQAAAITCCCFWFGSCYSCPGLTAVAQRNFKRSKTRPTQQCVLATTMGLMGSGH